MIDRLLRECQSRDEIIKVVDKQEKSRCSSIERENNITTSQEGKGQRVGPFEIHPLGTAPSVVCCVRHWLHGLLH